MGNGPCVLTEPAQSKPRRFCSFARSTALYQREKTGKGSFIDVSMLETGLTLMTSTIVDFLTTGTEPEQRGKAASGSVQLSP
ncbi:CoA transferase [Falsiruegeria mediterranea]